MKVEDANDNGKEKQINKKPDVGGVSKKKKKEAKRERENKKRQRSDEKYAKENEEKNFKKRKK